MTAIQVRFDNPLPSDLMSALDTIRSLVLKCVNEETQFPVIFKSEGWSKNNPMRGQCYSVSMLIQRILGGDIVRGHVIYNGKRESHYFNRIKWVGSIRYIDVSGEQYKVGGDPFTPACKPEEVLVFKFIRKRQKLLVDRYFALQKKEQGGEP